MKNVFIIFAIAILVGCSTKPEEKNGIKEFAGEVRYDSGVTSDLRLQFYFNEDFKDRCEIVITDSLGRHVYHSDSEGYGFPYKLKNEKLSRLVPLTYSLQWNSEQQDYDRLDGESGDGEIYATLLLSGFDYIEGVGTYSRRCQAITLKGTQCTRNAQKGRIYCYQHPRL